MCTPGTDEAAQAYGNILSALFSALEIPEASP
jgi:hypothetical protein